MSVIMTVNLILAVVNGVLALILGAVYARNHAQIRSGFTLALVLFALFFVVHNAVVVYHLTTMMLDAAVAGEGFLLAEGVLQTAALAALAYATLR
jgi:hypothetical protein